MKTKSLIIVSTLLTIMSIMLNCGNDNEPKAKNKSQIGYIMDYAMCSGIVYDMDNDSARADGYYIISENLQDTFATFNLPDNLNKFPVDFFRNTDNYRYNYKIRFEYEYKDTAILCITLYPISYPKAKSIKIISATSIN